MRLAHDADKTIVMELHKMNCLVRKFSILHANDQIKLIDSKAVQIGICLVEGKLRQNVVLRLKQWSEDFADEPICVGIGVANSRICRASGRNCQPICVSVTERVVR